MDLKLHETCITTKTGHQLVHNKGQHDLLDSQDDQLQTPKSTTEDKGVNIILDIGSTQTH